MTLRVVGLGDDAVDRAIAAGVERGAGDRFDRGADAETAIQRVEREKGVFQGARPAPDARAAPGGNERLYPGVDLEAAEGLTEIDALARGETVHCRGYLYAVGRVAVAVHGLQEGRDIARDFQRRGRVVRVAAVGVDEPVEWPPAGEPALLSEPPPPPQAVSRLAAEMMNNGASLRMVKNPFVLIWTPLQQSQDI